MSNRKEFFFRLDFCLKRFISRKFYLLRKIAKDERNKERLLEDKKKTEEELRNVTTSHDLAIKFNEETLADQEKEMKRLETREDLLRVPIFLLRFPLPKNWPLSINNFFYLLETNR